MRSILTPLLLLFSCSSWAAPVMVGNTSIEIPTPPGHARVIPEMTAVTEMSRMATAPGNLSLALFIPEDEVVSALSGEVPPMVRRYWVQTSKPAAARTFAPEHFAQMRVAMRAQQEAVAERLRAEIPGMANPAFGEISEKFHPDVLMRMGGVVTLPMHHEDANSIHVSMISRLEHKARDGSSSAVIVPSTYAIVNVKNRIVFLYVYGDKDDLAWTREQAKRWVRAVVAANR